MGKGFIMANTDKQDKIDALIAAIEAVRALGKGYVKMVYALEGDLYSLQQEVLADKKKEIELEEAKQNEKMLKTELKNARAKITRMQNRGVWGGAGYDAAQGKIVEVTVLLSRVWAK